jgi:fructokinase
MLSKIALFAAANLAGFTLNLNTMQPVKSGYIVARQETQNSFNKDGLKTSLRFAAKNDLCLGGWFDSESSRYYYDAVEVYTDLKQAINAGVLNNQIAIFDLYNNQEIRLK